MEESFKISEAERIKKERFERSKGKNCGICIEEVISLQPASGNHKTDILIRISISNNITRMSNLNKVALYLLTF